MGPAELGSRCSCRWVGPAHGGGVTHTSWGCLVFGEGAASACLSPPSQVEGRSPSRLRGVCFVCFKGRLEAYFPLKNLLPLARLPGWATA